MVSVYLNDHHLLVPLYGWAFDANPLKYILHFLKAQELQITKRQFCLKNTKSISGYTDTLYRLKN